MSGTAFDAPSTARSPPGLRVPLIGRAATVKAGGRIAPLTATLLLDLLRDQLPDAELRACRFRAVRPTFDLDPFVVRGEPLDDGRTIHPWAMDHEGRLTMDAAAALR